MFEKRDQDPKYEMSLLQLITLLTKVRASGYNSAHISNISSQSLFLIKQLSEHLGTQILETHHRPFDTNLYEKRLEVLCTPERKLQAVIFSCQLLQYFTIISHKDFDQHLDFHEFCSFLEENVEKFGDVSDNFLVIEYKLIKIYNELNHLLKTQTGQRAPVKNLEERMNAITEELNSFIKVLDTWTSKQPNNAFLSYLNFFHKYTCAKSIEVLQYLKSDGPSNKMEFKAAQKIFLDLSYRYFEKMSKLVEAPETSEVNGIEFCFGNNILSKLPSEDIEIVKGHLRELRQTP